MNGESRSGRGGRGDGVAPPEGGPVERDLAQMAPAADVPELPFGRHLLLKDHMMSEIEQARPETSPETSPEISSETFPETSQDASPGVLRPARRLRRRQLAAIPAMAAAIAAAAVVGVSVVGSPDRAPTVSAADRDAAGSLLTRAALAAEGKPEVPVRDGQYEYIERVGSYAVITGSGDAFNVALPPFSKDWTWIPVTGTGTMMTRGSTTGVDFPSEITNADQGLGKPNYRFLETLPTDPDALLALLRREAPNLGGNPRDEQAFTVIGDILRAHNTTPALTAALFRAAAKLDGVTIVRDVTDALGRPGVAVTQVQVQGGREEWIFDPQTAEFIGERAVVVKEADGVKKGTVLGNMAIVKRGFVDQLGQFPQADAAAPTRVVPTGPAV